MRWRAAVQEDCKRTKEDMDRGCAKKMEEADKDWMMIRMVGG